MRTLLASLWVVLIAFCFAGSSAASQAAAPQKPTADEQQTYQAFRSWMTSQPADLQQAADEIVYRRYADTLRAQGKSDKEIESTIALLRKVGDRAEIELWNHVVVFDTNELLKLFGALRVVRYEDTSAVADFGLTDTRVVRLAAIKPYRREVLPPEHGTVRNRCPGRAMRPI
jgi:hypothetical protein